MKHNVNLWADMNSKFSLSKTGRYTRVKEYILLYYLSIAGVKVRGFIPFPSILALCEMQAAPFKIWTQVTVSLSYDDNY